MSDITLEQLAETNPLFAQAKIRIHAATQQASVIDVIMMVTGKKSGNASRDISNLPHKLNMNQLRINGKGRKTWVAHAPICVAIIWELPGKAAKVFRGQCVHYIVRLLNGDRSLARLVMDIADQRENTTTIATTTIVANGQVSQTEAVNTHKRLVIQHVKDIKPGIYDTNWLESKVSKQSNNDVVVESYYVQKTESLDLQWGIPDTGASVGDACVYFVRLAGSEFVKVGKTQNINQRLSNLQVSSPSVLIIDFLFVTPEHDKYEKQLHQHLVIKGQHVRGEWFRITRGTNYFDLLAKALGLVTGAELFNIKS